jgi:hypothetical protein
MTKKIILALTSRTGLIALSILFCLLMLQGAWDILEDIRAIDQHQHAMEEILEGLGTILVAYGVALEERETLLKFLGVYPQAYTPQQARIDHHCHGYGLSLLLLGLFAEVSVYLIRMPDINTVDFDPALIVFATFLCLVGAGHLGKLSWLLWRDADPAVQADRAEA